jgi:hypothetical protein
MISQEKWEKARKKRNTKKMNGKALRIKRVGTKRGGKQSFYQGLLSPLFKSPDYEFLLGVI